MLCDMTMNARLAELGQRVRARRTAANLSIDAAADKAKISPVTWSRVELGRSVRELSYAGVERVLGWPPATCRTFLDTGKEPPKTVTGKAHINLGGQLEARGESRDPDQEWKDQIIAEGVAEAKKVLDDMNPDEAAQLLDQMRTLVAGFRARRGERQGKRRDAV